jgi:hypothetical protein
MSEETDIEGKHTNETYGDRLDRNMALTWFVVSSMERIRNSKQNADDGTVPC